MLVALPRSIQNLLEIVESIPTGRFISFKKIQDVFYHLFETISVLVIHKSILVPVRRVLLITGQEFESSLCGINAMSFQKFGGFSNLFQSAIDTGEVSKPEYIRLDDIGNDDFTSLQSVQETADALDALFEMSKASSLPFKNTAACMVMFNLEKMLNRKMEGFIKSRGFSKEVQDLFRLRFDVEKLTPQIFKKLENERQMQEFSLWFLADKASKQEAPEGHLRRLVDHLLERAGIV